jgi:hypothetical protein
VEFLFDRWQPWDADATLAALGVRLSYWPFRALLGVYFQDADGSEHVALRADLADPDNTRLRRQTIAHELGHRSRHRGEHTGAMRADTDALRSTRAELEAERWAGAQLCPPGLVKAFVERVGTVEREQVADLADRCAVTEAWLTWWLGDLRRRGVIGDAHGGGLHLDWIPHRPNGRFADLG